MFAEFLGGNTEGFGRGPYDDPGSFRQVGDSLAHEVAQLPLDAVASVGALDFPLGYDETDEAARAKWEHYKAGADEEALAWLTEQSQKDTRSGSDTNVRQMADPTSAVNINMGTLVGSYASVARMLDEVASVPGTDGVLLTFDDFLAGIDAFGERIQPLMRCRNHIASVTREVA